MTAPTLPAPGTAALTTGADARLRSITDVGGQPRPAISGVVCAPVETSGREGAEVRRETGTQDRDVTVITDKQTREDHELST